MNTIFGVLGLPSAKLQNATWAVLELEMTSWANQLALSSRRLTRG
jgi:hypothetical protein